MKVLYVASYDVSDLRSGNGVDHFKMRALHSAGCTILRYSPISVDQDQPSTAARIIRKITRQFYRSDPVKYRQQRLERIGKAIADHPSHAEAEVIVCPNHFDVSFYRGQLPVFIWTDATFHDMVSIYPEKRSLSPDVVGFEHAIQRRALQRANGVMWASNFAMRSAISVYSADQNRQAVTRFGLNLPTEPHLGETNEGQYSLKGNTLCLLFIGFDYKRKGFDIALAATLDLNRSGVQTRLVMIGGNPEIPGEARPFVDVLGPLDKRKPDQLAKFEDALRSAHFLIFPTQADVYCMPAIEAMSVGCPAIVGDVGGMSEIVLDNVTGFVLPLSASASDYANKLRSIIQRPNDYAAMRNAAYDRFQRSHRWERIGIEARAFIESMLMQQEMRPGPQEASVSSSSHALLQTKGH